MNFFNRTRFDSLEDLFVWELEDLYDAETRIVDALPQMIDAAHSQILKQAFQKHLGQTKRQVSRLEQCFHSLGKEAESVTCSGMKGIIAEGSEVIGMDGDADVKDAALIGAAQRVEHYEIAAYGTVRTYAEQLGHQDIVDLLQTTLEEESETDKELTRIAEQTVNVKAQHA